jgi:hypothetical protein
LAAHHPPALSVTVSRSLGQGHLLIVVWLFSLIAALAFVFQQTTVWPRIMVLGSCFVSGFWAWQYHQGLSSGRLHWDGKAWFWTHFDGVAAHDITVLLDFQTFILLRLRADNGQIDWLWLRADNADATWFALRRALVFGSKKSIFHA